MSKSNFGPTRLVLSPVFVLFIQLISGCSNLRSYPIPEIRGSRATPDEFATFSSAQAAKGATIKTFRGLYRSRITQGDQRLTTKQAVVFEKPNRIRVEAFPLNGGLSLGLLVGKEGKIIFTDPIQKTRIEGDSDQKLIYQALRLRLTRSELMTYLSGAIPEDVLQRGDSLLYRAAADGELALVGPEFRWYYLVSAESQALKRVELRSPLNQRLELRIDFLEYTKVSEFSVPSQIEIILPRDQVQIRLELVSAKLNQVVKSDLFD